jgi:hypothetical protein
MPISREWRPTIRSSASTRDARLYGVQRRIAFFPYRFTESLTREEREIRAILVHRRPATAILIATFRDR